MGQLWAFWRDSELGSDWSALNPYVEERRVRGHRGSMRALKGPLVVDDFIFLCGLWHQDIQTTCLNIVPWSFKRNPLSANTGNCLLSRILDMYLSYIPFRDFLSFYYTNMWWNVCKVLPSNFPRLTCHRSLSSQRILWDFCSVEQPLGNSVLKIKIIGHLRMTLRSTLSRSWSSFS